MPGRLCITIYTGPEQLGWPTRRPRVLNALLNPDTTVWVGSQNPAQEFASIFQKTCELNGCHLCIAPDEEAMEYLSKFAMHRGAAGKVHCLVAVDIRALLSPSGAKRFNAYVAERDRLGLTSEDAFFAEVDKSIKFGSCGSHVPALLRTGEIVNLSKNCMVTSKERFVCMGIPIQSYRRTSAHFSCPFDVELLTEAEQRHLTGNGMHCAVALAWQLYIISNVVRRAVLEGMSRELRPKAVQHMQAGRPLPSAQLAHKLGWHNPWELAREMCRAAMATCQTHFAFPQDDDSDDDSSQKEPKAKQIRGRGCGALHHGKAMPDFGALR